MKSIRDAARAGERPPGLEIVDVHAHLGMPQFSIPEWGPAEVAACAEALGVTQLWVSHISVGSAGFIEKNKRLAAWIGAFPGMFRGYLTPPPWSAAEARVETERCLAAGFLGIKLHNVNGIPYDAPEYEPAWAIAHARRLPVLLHTWGEPAMFASVERLAAQYPEASIIMGHGIQRNSPERYECLARDCENLHLDTCVSRSPRGRIEELVERIGPEKILFGSDVAFLGLHQQLGKIAFADIPDAAKRLIFSGNAARILERIRS